MKPIVFKRYRVLLVFSLIILLPASGALWAIADSRPLLDMAILLSGLSVVTLLAEEVVSNAIDNEVARLQAEVDRQTERIAKFDEAMRQEDRIVAMLAEQNSRVSAELVSHTAHIEAA